VYCRECFQQRKFAGAGGAQGGKLKLVNLTKRITDLLSITKLLTVFETFDVEQDAIRSFAG
jgi:anti-anti-sigma regulatory factor